MAEGCGVGGLAQAWMHVKIEFKSTLLGQQGTSEILVDSNGFDKKYNRVWVIKHSDTVLLHCEMG